MPRAGSSSAPNRTSGAGSPRTDRPVPRATAASPPRAAATTCTRATPARGRTACRSGVRRRDWKTRSTCRSCTGSWTTRAGRSSPTRTASSATVSAIARGCTGVYTSADPRFTGRVTVPALWDTERNTIVSNESSEIVRTLDTAFDTLDALEEILSRRCFLTGDAPLEADRRLFPTLLRFDLVYHGHYRDPGRRGHRPLRAAHRCAGEPDRDGLEGARERRRVLRRHRARPQPRRAEPLRVGRRGAAPLRRGPGRSRRPRRATPGRPRATSPRARTRTRAPARA